MRVLRTHCKLGHPLFGDNLTISKRGDRVCKECRAAYIREYQSRPDTKRAISSRQKVSRKQMTSEKRRELSKKATARNHGLTTNQYDKKLAAQNNLCGLCEQPFDLTQPGLGPSLDHNHTTGKLRDFCHRKCNAAIGLLGDDSALCRKATEYLEKHKEESYGGEINNRGSVGIE